MINHYITSVRGKLCAEYKEIETGKIAGRPELRKALAACRLHGAVLIVAKLDRLARNAAFVSNLMESGAEFCAVDFPQANRFIIHLLSAVAEYEAKLISDRTRLALARAAKRGVQLGGDRGNILRVQRKALVLETLFVVHKLHNALKICGPSWQNCVASGAVTLSQIAERIERA